MSKVLVLAQSGFGKSTSIGNSPSIDIEGLPVSSTFIVSVTSKPLPFKGSNNSYPITSADNLKAGKRVISNNPEQIQNILLSLVSSPFTDIVIDDFNYVMQDWYMNNALAKGWDGPKTIGYFMGKIFEAIEALDRAGKNIYILAHGESVLQPDGRTYMKFKSTGKMVDEYLTVEGKVDVVLIGVSRYDSAAKKVVREFLTNENEFYSSAKSPIEMFDKNFIPNDLGYVKKQLESYYNGE